MPISDILRHKQDHSPRPDGGTPVATISAEDSVEALVAALTEHNIGALVVLDPTGVAGIVSERDVVRRIARDGAGVLSAPVRDIMTTSVVTCGPGDDVESIAATMTERRIRHMPVIDGDHLVGIVSIGDVVSSRIRDLEQVQGHLEQYIAG